MKNIIKIFLTEEEIEQLKYHLAQIENILRGKLVVLSSKERSQFGSVNENNKLIINKVSQYHESEPSMSSPDVDWEEFTRDYKMRGFIEDFLLRMSSLMYDLESTKILHDYDNYRDALTDYAYAQYKNNSADGRFNQKVAELKQFFNRTGKKGKTKEK